VKNIKSHFKFNKLERSGIFFLLVVIVLLQIVYFAFRSYTGSDSSDSFSVDEKIQLKIDDLKENALKKDSVKIYPFNPNFITDYKGYALGMSVDEIDRLHAFGAQNKFANSPEEFQKVTQVSDSLLAVISPYFKFPEWTQKKSEQSAVGTKQHSQKRNSQNTVNSSSPEGMLVGASDLNKATAEDLKKINGIGEKLSVRIIKFRDRLGGFLVDEQLYDVYGLESEVVDRTLARFRVIEKPNITRVNINTASAEELSKLVYIRWHIAERIVDYREVNGGIASFDELKSIEDFPSDKIARIALYLSL